MISYKQVMESRGFVVDAELENSIVYAVRVGNHSKISFLAFYPMVVQSKPHDAYRQKLCFNDGERGHMLLGELRMHDEKSLTFAHVYYSDNDPDTVTEEKETLYTFKPLTLSEFNEQFRSGIDPHRQFLNTMNDVNTWLLRQAGTP